jgi:tRNA A-37 threonylcarbamoyl transferase component Bud32
MIGRTLKHYRIDALLGRGGMGEVYRALDTRLQRPVALKVIKSDLVADPDRRQRFILEARAAAAVNHPAIAPVYDIDEADGITFIAMEYVDGRTVGQLITQGELDLMGTVEIGLQVAEGLARAHGAGIIHRDIKSDNIMVTRDGHAKILDFGLAKLMDSSPEGGDASGAAPAWTLTMEQAQTIAGAVLGTLSYMSPEQARGRGLDTRSDIFSLGVVLYEMATGELPFKGDTPLDTMHAIAYEEARPVTAIRRNLPPKMHQIVSRCLRKNREDRYPDAHALAGDLKHLKQDLETGSHLSVPAGARLQAWLDSVKTWAPLSGKRMIVLGIFLIAAAVLMATQVRWGELIGPAVMVFFLYRVVRDRRRRMMARFTRKVAMLPEVKAVAVRNDQIIVVLDRAPAKTYIRVSSLLDAANGKLFYGKPIAGTIRDDMADEELRTLIKQPGAVYVRDDVVFGPPGEGSTSGGSPKGRA